MTSSGWTLGSSVFGLLIVAALIFKQKAAKYHAQVATILATVYYSCYYHACWTSPEEWCIGTWGGSSADISYARDMMSAFLAMNAATSILVREWLLKQNEYDDEFAWYYITVNMITVIMVVHLNDSAPTVIMVALLNGFPLALSIWVESRHAEKQMGVVWWISIGVAFGFFLLAIIFKYSVNSKSLKPYDEIPESYFVIHGLWHMFSALGATILIMITENTGMQQQNSKSYTQVKKNKPII